MDRLSYFGDRLTDLLTEKGVSKKDLSERTGIKLSRIYDYTDNLHAPSLMNAVKIADEFHCPLDFLFGFIDEFTPKITVFAIRSPIASEEL